MAVSARLLRPTRRGFYSPRQIDGLALWLDASATETLLPISDAVIADDFSPGEFTGVTPYLWVSADNPSNIVVNGRVESLADKSGNTLALNATAYGGGVTAPLLVSNCIGGLPAMRFNGTTDGLITQPYVGLTPLALCVVAVVRINASSAVMQSVVGIEDYGDEAHYISVAPNSTLLGVSSATGPAFRAEAPKPVIIIATYDPATATRNVYHNGRLVATGVDTAIMYDSQLISLGRGGLNVAPYAGNPASCDIAEAVIYSNAFAAGDINKLTLYYSKKYSITTDVSPASQTLAAVNAPTEIAGCAGWWDASDTASLYTTDAGPVAAVRDPLDIAGCQLWLDASDAASITASSGEVTAWADKSATGSSWTRVGGANGPATGTQTMGGKNVVVFDGTNDGLSAVTPLNTSMPLTFFVVQRVVSGTVAGMTYTAGTGDNFNWRQAADALGALEVTAGGSRMQLGGALLSQNTLYSLTVPASSNASLYRDGTVVSISTNATLKPTLTGTHYLGRRVDGFYANVHIAEIVAYSAELTTAQRASVESYLAAKWGISGVHAPATATSDPVGYWADKSGSGRNLLQPTSTARPAATAAAVNGRTALTFDGTDFLSVATPVALGDNTVIMVVREDVSVNYGGLFCYYPATGNDNNNVNGWVADLQLADNIISLSSGAFALTWTGVTTLPISVVTLRRQIDAGDRQMIRANGITQAVNASASTGTAAGILIGGRFQSGVVDTLYRARITLCEVVRWDRALTPVEYARVEKYLQQKWATPTVPDPTLLVGAWLDKSGNGRHAVQATAGSRPVVGTLNSRNALTFDGTDDNLRHTPSTALGSAEVTHIAVLRNNLTSQPNLLYPPGIMTAGNVGRPLDRWQGLPLTGAVFVGAFPQVDVTSPFRSLDSRFVFILDGKKDGVSAGTHQLREFINGASIYSATSTGTWATTSQRINIGTRDDGGTRYKGDICELLMYDRRLTTTERQRLERYLAARWGITLAPTVANADAQNWIDRVYQNGGSVSSATAAAVNQFCVDLENAPGGSIRDRFFRLNLFCGSFQGAFVPLFRGPSMGGTQYGGTTDLNLGSPAFLDVTDYQERGASGGLKGNGSTKYLNTGFNVDLISAANSHMSAGLVTAESASGFKSLMGANISLNTWELYARRSAGSGIAAACFGSATTESHRFGSDVVAATLAAGHIIASYPAMYRNGTAAGTTASSNGTVGSVAVSVFAQNSGGTVGSHTDARLSSYSLGLGMTASQAAAFSTAHAAFNAALGRA